MVKIDVSEYGVIAPGAIPQGVGYCTGSKS